jgi:Fe-S oxidoreductase
MMAENVSKTGFPVPVPPESVYSWAKPLNIPRGKPTVIYTGALYQLVPYINSLVKTLEQLEKSSAGGVALRLARIVGRVVDLSKLVAKPERKDVEWAEEVLRSIARLLSSAGVDYGYVYEKDLYSGTLLYDLGLDDAFASHAARVYKELKSEGVRKVITVDPHTTHVLREAYPKYVDGFDIEVVSYLEILSEKGIEFKSGEGGSWVIHDPCFYARYAGIVQQPRELLKLAGYTVVEPKRTRELTYCCGGPLESISPGLSRRIAEMRMKELASRSKNVVTLCPICYANLSRVKPEEVVVSDIALLLASRLAQP